MQNKISFFIVLLLCAAIGIAGCTGTTGTPATPIATATPAPTQVPTALPQNNLVTSPTDVVPDNNQVTVIVQEKDYLGQISVVMGGGKGQILVKSARIVLYTSDGQIINKELGINKDDTTKLQGTKQVDRVVVYVSEVNGQEYKVVDVLSDYRTR
jgi:hypothetical protein